MFEDTKRQIIKAGMSLDRYGLIALSGGNVSVRMPSGEILVTPSGMIYEDLVEDFSDVLLIAVAGGAVDEAITAVDRIVNGGSDVLIGEAVGPESTDTGSRHGRAGIQRLLRDDLRIDRILVHDELCHNRTPFFFRTLRVGA